MRRPRPFTPGYFVLIAVVVAAIVLLDGLTDGFDTVNWGVVIVFPVVMIGVDIAVARGNRRDGRST